MLQIIADLGEFHRIQSAYNTSTVIELLRYSGVKEVYSAVYFSPEHPLSFALKAAGIAVHHMAPNPEPYVQEQQKLWEYLNQYKQGKSLLRQKQLLDQEVVQLLRSPHTAQSIHGTELLAALDEYHSKVVELLEEGVATAGRKKRLSAMAQTLLQTEGTLLVAVDDIPEMLRQLPLAQVLDVSGFRAGEASRLRALADRASLLDENDDLDALLHNVQQEKGDVFTPKAELNYWAANIYLAVGDVEGAYALLTQAAHDHFEHPEYLPGLVYARLGQVRDARGERDNAIRAYRAVLALNYAPEIAREAASTGLKEPFTLSPE